jgi:hypothetical protein
LGPRLEKNRSRVFSCFNSDRWLNINYRQRQHYSHANARPHDFVRIPPSNRHPLRPLLNVYFILTKKGCCVPIKFWINLTLVLLSSKLQWQTHSATCSCASTHSSSHTIATSWYA